MTNSGRERVCLETTANGKRGREREIDGEERGSERTGRRVDISFKPK